MDHHVPRAITNGLRLREVDVLTAYEDGMSEVSDPVLLDRASELERVLFTRDDDLLAEATQRRRQGQTFNGVIYAHQLNVSIGDCVHALESIAKVGEPEDMTGRTLFLPL
jgi:predicted nuclease of predicted toxin-antitoxin system